ncbi:hypothetical protein RSJ42_15270 [Methanosarcina hadiensis]|uniref:hypothetical protein n=1 Tax=Methanosarcina hadiensis TaxID=3078083 RepID=UPI003977D352
MAQTSFIYGLLSILCILAFAEAKVKKINLFTIDNIFSIIGFILGLFITSLNLVYSNKYLLTLGPLLCVACLLYFWSRDIFLTDIEDFNLGLRNSSLKIINILYYISMLLALIIYYIAPTYSRPGIFFVLVSAGVTFLGLEILASKSKSNYHISFIIAKIMITSIFLRASAYFISPFPIGSDPWEHYEYIKYFLQYQHLTVPSHMRTYYCSYPLAHILSVVINLISNLSIKESMFFLGIVSVLSTIFVYLFAITITKDQEIALFSLLLINFADFHIQWSIEVIPMTFGIAIYSILLYLIIKDTKKDMRIKFILLLFLFLLVWTHTISSFISVLSIISLYIGSILYHIIYKKGSSNESLVSITVCIVFTTIILIHWMEPGYPFFDMVTKGLVNSLSQEAKFLGRDAIANEDSIKGIFNIFGFLTYIFFGVIGSLYYLSKKKSSTANFSLIFMLIVLFFVFFVFPLMGIRDIIPYRWPAFIYVSFSVFISIGIINSLSIIKSSKCKFYLLLCILSITSFFMMTNFASNTDSPIYCENLNQKMIFTESELKLFERATSLFNGSILTDEQTRKKPFNLYLQNYNVGQYPLTLDQKIDFDHIHGKLIIWRRTSLERPIDIFYNSPKIVLGNNFEKNLDDNFHCLFNMGEAKAYLAR